MPEEGKGPDNRWHLGLEAIDAPSRLTVGRSTRVGTWNGPGRPQLPSLANNLSNFFSYSW